MFWAVNFPSPRRFLKTRCNLSDRLSNMKLRLDHLTWLNHAENQEGVRGHFNWAENFCYYINIANSGGSTLRHPVPRQVNSRRRPILYSAVPFANNSGVRLYWEDHGQGPPLLMIMGLSFTLEMWSRVVPEFARDHRVIVFDNRGVGRSDVPRGRYSIGTMSEDALAVLAAAEVHEPAFVLGASMGGMIAQELALRSPDRVRALILGCTACGPLLRAAWPNLKRSPGFCSPAFPQRRSARTGSCPAALCGHHTCVPY